MNHEHAIGDSQELAALYLAGAMTATEQAAFEAHLASGCPRCREELRNLDAAVEALGGAPAEVAPDPEIRRRLLGRMADAAAASSAEPAPASGAHSNPQVWKRWSGDEPGADWFIQRDQEADWEATGIEGIHIRRLFVDRARNQISMLVRMAPGTAYPRHVHDGPEECLVLEGDLRAGEEVFRKGDYQRMSPGSRHGIQSSDGGCLLFIVSSLSDELE